jgi:hypothetical protein
MSCVYAILKSFFENKTNKVKFEFVLAFKRYEEIVGKKLHDIVQGQSLTVQISQRIEFFYFQKTCFDFFFVILRILQ